MKAAPLKVAKIMYIFQLLGFIVSKVLWERRGKGGVTYSREEEGRRMRARSSKTSLMLWRERRP